MKTTSFRGDELISDVAFFFLVALTALAVMNYVSVWVVSGCFLLYIVIGILVACVLPHEQRMQEKKPGQKPSARPGSAID